MSVLTNESTSDMTIELSSSSWLRLYLLTSFTSNSSVVTALCLHLLWTGNIQGVLKLSCCFGYKIKITSRHTNMLFTSSCSPTQRVYIYTVFFCRVSPVSRVRAVTGSQPPFPTCLRGPTFHRFFHLSLIPPPLISEANSHQLLGPTPPHPL